MHPRADKPDPVFFLRLVEVQLIVLAIGPHIHIKNGRVQAIIAMFFGNDGFFHGIHAAHGRAVAVVTAIQVSGAHALKPSDLFRFLLIRWPFEMPKIGTC